jgi:hypothetical protein
MNMAIKYSEQTKHILKISEATANIVKTLDPLSERSKRRVLLFFADLVQDPAQECTFAQLEILKEVAAHLGIENVV